MEGWAAFQLALGAVGALARSVERYEGLTTFPGVRQDLAVVVGDQVPAAEAGRLVREAGAPLLDRADVFDVYAGEQVGPERRSLALHLEFRAPDRTLTDAEVAAVRERIVAALRDRLGGEPRA